MSEHNVRKKAEEWAEQNHISALVDKKEVNILFAKKLAEEAYLAGYEESQKHLPWRSVEEGLPEKKQWVLVYCTEVWDNRPIQDAMFIYFDEEQKRAHWLSTGNVITHWMPFPEPPK